MVVAQGQPTVIVHSSYMRVYICMYSMYKGMYVCMYICRCVTSIGVHVLSWLWAGLVLGSIPP